MLRRISPLALAAFLLILWAWAAQATLLLGRWPTGSAALPVIGSINLPGGTTFPAGSPSGTTISSITVTMTSGSFSGGSIALATNGVSCPGTNNGSFQVIGTSPWTLATNGSATTGVICLKATLAGASNSPFYVAYTITAVSTTQTTGLFGIDTSVTDTSGNSYTVCGTNNEQICQNGVVDPITGGVVLVTWYSGNLYQENNTQAWYEWNSASYPTWGSGGGSQWTFLGTGPSSAPSGWSGITFVSLSNSTFTTPTSGTTAIGNFTITATSAFTGTNVLSTSSPCGITNGSGNIALNISGTTPNFTLNAINGVWPWSLSYCTVLTQSGFVNSGLAFTGTAVGSTPGITTYYMATAAEGGSDSNNGTSVTTPWLTPNHAALACGNQIIAQAGTYASANLVVTTAPTCSGGNNAVIVACEITHECGGDMGGGNGPQIKVSNFGFVGWSVHDCNACFSATPAGSASIGYIVDADDIAYNGQQEGFTVYNNGSYGVDNLIWLGNLSQNTSQTTGNCDSGMSVGVPINDASSSHRIYAAWNMSWDNTTTACLIRSTVTASISGTTLTVTSGSTSSWQNNDMVSGAGVAVGTTITAGSGSSWTISPSQTVGSESITVAQSSDNTGLAFDTWSDYTGTGVAENNWFIHNGGAGMEVTGGNGTQGSHATLLIRNNTTLNNLTIHQNSTIAEIAAGSLYGTTITNNLTWGQLSKVPSWNAPTGMFVGINDDVSGSGGSLVDNNFDYEPTTGWGDAFWNGSGAVLNCISPHTIIGTPPFNSDSFQNVGCSGDSWGTNPSITSPTADPGVPSSCDATFALSCVATYITDYESSVASNAGAQVAAPSDANNTTTFECNIYAIMPAGWFTTGGGYIPNRSSSCSAGPGGAVVLTADNALCGPQTGSMTTNAGTIIANACTGSNSGAPADVIPSVGSTQTLTFPFSITENGGVSEPERVVVFNTGTPSLSVSSITYTGGSNPSDFSTATTNCSGTLTHNSYCYVWANFSPTTVGAETANMNINFTSGTVSLALSGTGVALGGGGSIVNVGTNCSLLPSSLATNTLYIIGDVTCSGHTFHGASGAIVQGDCKSPEGASTTLDGNSNIEFLTSGWNDGVSNVTIRCLTIQHYGYDGTACPNNGNGEIQTWTGWLVANVTFQLSCGQGWEMRSASELYDIRATNNAWRAGGPSVGTSGGSSGTMLILGAEMDHNSTNSTSATNCGTNFDCGGYKQTIFGPGPYQSVVCNGCYIHDNIGPNDSAANWIDVGSGSLTAENCTAQGNGGEGLRNETNWTQGQTPAGSATINDCVIFNNEKDGYGVSAAVDGFSADVINASHNYIVATAGAAIGIGPDFRQNNDGHSGDTFTINWQHNIVVMVNNSFGYGLVSWDGTNCSCGTSITSNNNTFYTSGQSTSASLFANNPNSTSTESFASWKSNTGQDGSSTIQGGTPTALTGCTGDGTNDIGCRGSGM